MLELALLFVRKNAGLIAGILVAAAVVALGFWIKHEGVVEGRAEVQAKWDADKNARIAAENQLKEETLKKTEAAQAAQLLKEKKYADDVSSANTRIAALTASLRNRPNRPNGVSNLPTNTTSEPNRLGCTGAGLYKADGEFLTREFAGTVKQLQIALKKCYSEYSDAEKLVNGTN